MQPRKKRRLNRESSTEPKGPQKEKAIIISQSNLAIVLVEGKQRRSRRMKSSATKTSPRRHMNLVHYFA